MLAALLLCVMGQGAEAPAVDGERSTADDVLIILDDDAPPATEAPVPVDPSRTWFLSELSTRLLVDTGFDQRREDVLEWWSRLRLRLDHRQSAALRGVMDAWVRWGAAYERPKAGSVAFRRGKWVGLVELREAFVS